MREVCRESGEHLCHVTPIVSEEIAARWPERLYPDNSAWAGRCRYYLDPPMPNWGRGETIYETSSCRLLAGHGGEHDMSHRYECEVWYADSHRVVPRVVRREARVAEVAR